MEYNDEKISNEKEQKTPENIVVPTVISKKSDRNFIHFIKTENGVDNIFDGIM